jgi:hypothetical protein
MEAIRSNGPIKLDAIRSKIPTIGRARESRNPTTGKTMISFAVLAYFGSSDEASLEVEEAPFDNEGDSGGVERAP